MGIQLKWESVEVEALLNDMDTHDVLEAFKPLEQYLEDRPAIYMWKLKADTKKLEEAKDWDELFEIIDKRLKIPFGKIPRTQVKRLHLGESYIQGKSITTVKKKGLKEKYDFHQSKKYIIELIKTLDTHTPSLYVGQTHQLRQRTRQHLNGTNSDFGRIVQSVPELEFKDMCLYFCYVEDLANEDGTDGNTIRETLEWTATMLTFGGYNVRDG